MPVSGNYGTPSNPNGDVYASFWELQWYTGSDPAHVEGDLWGRSDLTESSRIATLRFDNGNDVDDIPVYPESIDPNDSSVPRVARVETPNGNGWVPIADSGTAYPYLRFQHAGALYSMHENLVPIPASAVSRWTFDDVDTSASTATDVWGTNDGTIDGATTGVSGANQTYTTSEAYEFDGTNDLVDIPQELGFSVANSSIAFWFRTPSPTSSTQGLFNAWGSDAHVVITLNSNGEVRFAGGSDATDPAATTSAVSANQWNHAACTFPSNDTVVAYLNGQQEDSTTAGTLNRRGSTFVGSIGRWFDNDNYFEGRIDDVRVYSTALSSTDVANLYNDGHI